MKTELLQYGRLLSLKTTSLEIKKLFITTSNEKASLVVASFY